MTQNFEDLYRFTMALKDLSLWSENPKYIANEIMNYIDCQCLSDRELSKNEKPSGVRDNYHKMMDILKALYLYGKIEEESDNG